MRNKKSVVKQIRKISIGVMSCVLGYTLVLSPAAMAAGAAANANGSSSIESKAASGNMIMRCWDIQKIRNTIFRT